ncbi:MAG: Gfo/Idh/MocA family protein [Verrucomicrobiales bacterium]
MTPLRLAIAGCGSRGRTYARIAAQLSPRYSIVAAADPDPAARAQIALVAGENCREFASADELIEARPDADAMVIATQDETHHELAIRAMEAGYDLLLEKPAATNLEHVLAIRETARATGKKVVLCYVLRHTPFYRAIRDFLSSGRLGKIVNIQMVEGVEPYHQAHSFVRGHWSREQDSSPMILAKSCHDMDIMQWLVGSPARALSSFGRLGHFHKGNAPAGSTARCTDGCPHSGSCFYDAHRYLSDKRRWLNMILPNAESMDDASILDFLRSSPWGRCVWHCDNDVVDHQVIGFDFENGVSGTFTMSAFDSGRQISIMGTEGVLKGGADGTRTGAPELWFRSHASESAEAVALPPAPEHGYAGHGGGDYGIIDALDKILRGADSGEHLLDSTLESHFMAFAAEQSRREDGRRILLDELRG